MSDVTRILTEIERGKPAAAEQLVPLVYIELPQLAAAKLARHLKDVTCPVERNIRMKAAIGQLLVVLILLGSTRTVFALRRQEGVLERADMVLWFDKPAENRSDSLAIGNGRMGAVLHHGVTEELIQISEETLWANGPVSVEIDHKVSSVGSIGLP